MTFIIDFINEFAGYFKPEPQPQQISKFETLYRWWEKVKRIEAQARQEGDLNNLIRAQMTSRKLWERMNEINQLNRYNYE